MILREISELLDNGTREVVLVGQDTTRYGHDLGQTDGLARLLECITERFPSLPWIRVMHAICAAIMFFLTWQVWIKATRIASYSDTTDVLRITIGPFVYFMAVMIALTGAVHVFKVFEKPR